MYGVFILFNGVVLFVGTISSAAACVGCLLFASAFFGFFGKGFGTTVVLATGLAAATGLAGAAGLAAAIGLATATGFLLFLGAFFGRAFGTTVVLATGLAAAIGFLLFLGAIAGGAFVTIVVSALGFLGSELFTGAFFGTGDATLVFVSVGLGRGFIFFRTGFFGGGFGGGFVGGFVVVVPATALLGFGLFTGTFFGKAVLGGFFGISGLPDVL